MATMNILGMSEGVRQELVVRAQRELAAGDDYLARQIAVAAGQQLAALLRHHADEILTALETFRNSVTAPATHNRASHHERCCR